MIVSLLADFKVKGVKLIELQDGRGENAICAAIAREDTLFVYEKVFHPQLGRNSKGREPLEMALEHGQFTIFNDILLYSYVPLLQSEKAEDRNLARFDIANAMTLLARSWTGLPNIGRTWLLWRILTGYRDDDVSIIPVEHCVRIIPVEHCVGRAEARGYGRRLIRAVGAAQDRAAQTGPVRLFLDRDAAQAQGASSARG
jgi:hypothetical protein